MIAATERDIALLTHPVTPPVTVPMAAPLLDRSTGGAAAVLAELEHEGVLRRDRRGWWRPIRPCSYRVAPAEMPVLCAGLVRLAAHLNGCALQLNQQMRTAHHPGLASEALGGSMEWFDEHAEALLMCVDVLADEQPHQVVVAEAAKEFCSYLAMVGRWEESAYLARVGLQAARLAGAEYSTEACRVLLVQALRAGGEDERAARDEGEGP